MKFVIYAPGDVAQMLAGVTATQTEAEWRTKALAAIAKALEARPSSYLSFGPFWWPVKAQLVAAGLLPWATEPDPDRVAQVTLGSESLDLAAGLAYQEFNIDQMRTGQRTFSVDTDDGDTVDYALVDDQAEAMMAAPVG